MKNINELKLVVRICLVLSIMFVVTACSTPLNFSPKEFVKDIELKYPPVSIVVNGGVVKTLVQEDFNEGILKAIHDSKLFYGMLYNEPTWPFQFDITLRMSQGDKEWTNFGLYLFSALSLFLIPVQTYHEIHMDVSVKVNNKAIKNYSYALKGGKMNHLFRSNVSDSHDAANALISYFLSDFQKDGLIETIRSPLK